MFSWYSPGKMVTICFFTLVSACICRTKKNTSSTANSPAIQPPQNHRESLVVLSGWRAPSCSTPHKNLLKGIYPINTCIRDIRWFCGDNSYGSPIPRVFPPFSPWVYPLLFSKGCPSRRLNALLWLFSWWNERSKSGHQLRSLWLCHTIYQNT